MSTTPKCHWDADLGWLTPEHKADCQDDCAGCRPCPKTHCALFGKCANHVDVAAGIVTCPGCIGKVRGDLAAVVDLSTQLLDEAIEKGVDSEAAVLHGPAAHPEAFAWRRAARAKREGLLLSDLEADDERHPYLVLGRWDLMIREDYGPATDLEITINRAHDYLSGQLGRIAQDDDQDFEQFAREIRTCRTHLETVLGDSRKPELGVPCPACREGDEENPPRLVKKYQSGDRSGASDEWVCPWDSAHKWSEADYRLRVGGDYVQHADRLTSTQMHEAHGVKPGSLTGWATAGKVRKFGKDHTGRQLYSVEDALRMTTPNAQTA